MCQGPSLRNFLMAFWYMRLFVKKNYADHCLSLFLGKLYVLKIYKKITDKRKKIQSPVEKISTSWFMIARVRTLWVIP